MSLPSVPGVRCHMLLVSYAIIPEINIFHWLASILTIYCSTKDKTQSLDTRFMNILILLALFL